MAQNYAGRASELFQSSRVAIEADLKALTAVHAAAGRLQSGATAKRAVRIFENHTGRALTQALEEMAKHIEHRGRPWDDASKAIGQAMESHLADARVILEKPLKHAGAIGGNAASNAVDRLIAEASEKLRAQLNEFRDGWTSPRPKAWKDRHPYQERLLFALAGAVIATAVAYMSGLVGVP